MAIEQLDYLAVAFEMEGESHHSQISKTPLKVKMLFWIPKDDLREPADLVSIRIPRGLAIYRLRTFVSAMESELSAIYGLGVKRANIVFICNESETQWKTNPNLPMYDVHFV